MKWKLLLTPLLGIALVACGGKNSMPTAAAPVHNPQKYDGTWKFNFEKTKQAFQRVKNSFPDDRFSHEEQQRINDLLEEILSVYRLTLAMLIDSTVDPHWDYYLQVHTAANKITPFSLGASTEVPLAGGQSEAIQPFLPTIVEQLLMRATTGYGNNITLAQIRDGTAQFDWTLSGAALFRSTLTNSLQAIRDEIAGGAELHSLFKLSLNPHNHNELRVGLVSYQLQNGPIMPPFELYYDRIQPLDPAVFVEPQANANQRGAEQGQRRPMDLTGGRGEAHAGGEPSDRALPQAGVPTEREGLISGMANPEGMPQGGILSDELIFEILRQIGIPD